MGQSMACPVLLLTRGVHFVKPQVGLKIKRACLRSWRHLGGAVCSMVHSEGPAGYAAVCTFKGLRQSDTFRYAMAHGCARFPQVLQSAEYIVLQYIDYTSYDSILQMRIHSYTHIHSSHQKIAITRSIAQSLQSTQNTPIPYI